MHNRAVFCPQRGVCHGDDEAKQSRRQRPQARGGENAQNLEKSFGSPHLLMLRSFVYFFAHVWGGGGNVLKERGSSFFQMPNVGCCLRREDRLIAHAQRENGRGGARGGKRTTRPTEKQKKEAHARDPGQKTRYSGAKKRLGPSIEPRAHTQHGGVSRGNAFLSFFDPHMNTIGKKEKE